ncbi:MAG: hypothetical protein ACK4NP_08185 [Parvularculaceae bacterium]
MKSPAFLIAACAAGLGLAACETTAYGSGGVIGSATSPGLFAGAIDPAALKSHLASTDAIEAAAVAQARAAPLLDDHEKKAAALFTGRLFLAAGKILSAPAIETPRAFIEETSPAGWRRRDNLLVHEDSGLECPLEFDIRPDKKQGSLRLKDVTVYDQDNRDISCNYTYGGAASVSIHAAYHPAVSVEDHAAAAVKAMRQSFTLKGVLPVIQVEIEDKDAGTSTADLEAPIAGAFDIGEIAGAPYKTALWIAKTHGWHVKARATYAQSDATTELVAAVIFAVNYLNVDMKQKTAPAATSPEV